MLRVALTGGIASGKSVVAAALAERGAVVIDADVLAREVVEPGSPALAAIVDRFGPEALDGDRLDRAAVGRVVFADAAARRDLEAIIHPAVRRRAAELEAAVDLDAVVVHVIPLLVETGQQEAFDVLVVVDADHETQVRRLRARNGLDRAAAEQRIGAQADRAERVAVADHVLDNSGDRAELQRQIDDLWAELDPRAPRE